MMKVQVSQEIAEALKKVNKDDWTKQFYLIAHCRGYSGNGIHCGDIYTDELKPLENLQPLEFAQCILGNYEIVHEGKDEKLNVQKSINARDNKFVESYIAELERRENTSRN